MTDEAGGGDGEAGSAGASGGRSMRKGRWRPTKEGAASGPMVTSTLSVKCTAAELEVFDAQCAALGVKRNRLMRALMRRAGGFVETDQAVVEELRAITRQLSGVATNINQIARVANRTQRADLAALSQERAALGAELARVEALMQRVLDHAARRSDGRKRLAALIRDG